MNVNVIGGKKNSAMNLDVRFHLSMPRYVHELLGGACGSFFFPLDGQTGEQSTGYGFF